MLLRSNTNSHLTGASTQTANQSFPLVITAHIHIPQIPTTVYSMECEAPIFLVPEIQKHNAFSFTQNAEKVMFQPVVVPGYRTWVLTGSLGRFCPPFTLVAIPTPNKTAKLYPVRFIGGIPDFHSLGLETQETPQGHVVCMSPEAFWRIERDNLCIPMSVTDWKAKMEYFNVLVALHRLRILPTLTKQTFKEGGDLECYENDLNAQFGTETSLKASLPYLFKSTFFALNLFGFLETDNQTLKTKYKQINDILESGEEIHAFSEIEPALVRYNEVCGDVVETKFLSAKNYKLLMRSVAIVIHVLVQIGFDVTDNASLSAVIKRFQSQHGIPVTGVCDGLTIRVLWDIVVSSSMDVTGLLAEAGFLRNGESRRDSEKPLIDEVEEDQGLDVLKDSLNGLIAGLPDNEIAELWLENQIERGLGDVAMRCMTLNERLSSIDRRMKATKVFMERIAEMNAKSDSLLDDSSLALADVLKAHIKAQEKFEEIKLHIAFQRRTNHILTIVGLLFLIGLVLKAVHVFPFR